MAPKLNIKKVLVEKGELVGVIAAGAITLLFAIVALVMTAKAESPTALAKKLKDQTQTVDHNLKTPPRTPNADWLPKTDPEKQATFVTQSIELPSRSRRGYFFASTYPMDDKALQPRIYPFSGEKLSKGEEYREGLCYFEYAQPRVYIFSKDGEKVFVLEDSKSTGGLRVGNTKQGARTASLRGPGGRPLPNIPGQPPQETAGAKEGKLIEKNLDELANLTGFKLAETVSPVRMGVIVANFPYRLQLKEFCNALYMSPEAMLDAVMEEPVLDADGNPQLDKDKKPVVKVLPAFRFKGVYVQRRQVDAGGSPVPVKGADGKMNPDGWYDVQLEEAYRGYIYVSGKRTAADPPELDPVLIDGLSMSRLLEMRDRNYKHIELDLPHIKAAIKPFLDNTGKPHFRPKEFQQDDDFNPYAIQRPTTGPAMDNRGGPGFLTGSRPGVKPTGGTPRPGDPRPGDPTVPKVVDPVQSCLIRLIDVTNLEPGKNYEYRVKVRMANPNYKKEASQVANPKFILEPELVSEEWYPIPGRLVVPGELNVYAVDQKEIEGKEYKGIFGRVKEDPRVATVLQFHTWVKEMSYKGSRWPVGEWCVGERVIVNRGEYIDRSVKVLVPSWRSQAEAFVLVGNVVDADKPTGADVYFGDNRYQSILLDFDNGDLTYVRSRDQTVREKARGEVLILTPDGRIQAHDTVTDKDSSERQDRLTEWRTRIDEVRTGAKAGAAADPKAGPFGK